MSEITDPGGRQVFRSPAAVVIWWVWVLFAVANLIDLAVQGRDHLSVVAAFSLLAVTGLVYVLALRPRIVADADGLTIVNPVRVHRVGWAAIAGFDKTDLLRVRCEWPAADETVPGPPAGEASVRPGEAAGAARPPSGPARHKRSIYSWAARSSVRGQIAAEARAKRQQQRGRGPGLGGVLGGGLGGGLGGSRDGLGGRGGLGGRDDLGGFAAPAPDTAPPPAPLGLDAAHVAVVLTERLEKARAATDARAVPPLTAWQWPAIAAVVLPALALLVAILA